MVQSGLGTYDVFIFISTTSYCLFLQMSGHTCGLTERVGYGEKELQREPCTKTHFFSVPRENDALPEILVWPRDRQKVLSFFTLTLETDDIGEQSEKITTELFHVNVDKKV